MAISTRTMHRQRQRDYSRLFIALGVLAGVMAVAPIVAAVLGIGGTAVTTRTAFASAPAGEYAVLGRSEGSEDVISVAWADNPGAVTEVARVRHLEGFTSTGAVSPDGKKVALVTVDGGSRTAPRASLQVVNLETGKITSPAADVVPSQTPVWSRGSDEIVVTRMPSGNVVAGTVQTVTVQPDGGDERVVSSLTGVLGVYPVAFDTANRLVTVVINGTGSTVHRDGAEPMVISSNITRDWKLSPDGAELAFIDADTAAGVRYVARTVRLDGGAFAAESLAAASSALGTAWAPDGRVSFGFEPGQATNGFAQALTAGPEQPGSGFDVPQGYSGSGDALVVTHWSGPSFQESGQPVLQIVTPDGRATYETFTRFYGWSER